MLPANHPPLVGPQVVVTTTGTAVSGNRRAAPTRTMTPSPSVAASRPARARLWSRADGSFTYTPLRGFSGVDTFTVVACDDGDPQLCSTAAVTVNVYPIAVDDRDSTTEGTPVSIPVLGNDSGAMNEPPEVTSPPSSGTVRVVGKRIVYEPDAGFTGTDSFDYRICSPGAVPLCAEATVTVDVAPAPAPPEPPSPTPSPGTGGSNGGPGSTTEVSSPTLGGLAATGGPAITIVAGGLLMVLVGAALVLSGRRRPRTPPTRTRRTTTARPTRPTPAPTSSLPPVNQPPVGADLDVAGQSDSLLLGRVTATDPDVDQTLRFSGPVSGPGSGRAVMAGGGAFLYRPDTGFAGHDSFTYQVCDNGVPTLCDTATVFAAISPVAADDQARTFEETPVLIPVVANDVVGGVLDSIDTDPANGTATIVGGQVQYTPDAGVHRHGHVHLRLLLARRERRAGPVHDGRGDRGGAAGQPSAPRRAAGRRDHHGQRGLGNRRGQRPGR